MFYGSVNGYSHILYGFIRFLATILREFRILFKNQVRRQLQRCIYNPHKGTRDNIQCTRCRVLSRPCL